MAVDKSGRWWKGEDFDDLAYYIGVITAEGYPANRVEQSICACGNKTFRLFADPDEGCAARRCAECGQRAFIADSSD